MNIGDLLQSDSAVDSLFIIILLMVAATLLVQLLVRKRRKSENDNETKSLLSNSIATMNAILLAFIIAIVWGKYLTLRDDIATEASAVANVARDANMLEDPARTTILNGLEDYTDRVLKEDWPVLIRAKHHEVPELPQMASSRVLNQIWSAALDPKLPWGAATSNMLDNLNEISKARTHRFSLAQQGLSNELWYVILLAVIMTIYSVVSRHSESAARQLPLFLLYGCFLGLILWLMVDIDHPFAGTQAIEPTPFVQALTTIQTLKSGSN